MILSKTIFILILGCKKKIIDKLKEQFYDKSRLSMQQTLLAMYECNYTR